MVSCSLFTGGDVSIVYNLRLPPAPFVRASIVGVVFFGHLSVTSTRSQGQPMQYGAPVPVRHHRHWLWCSQGSSSLLERYRWWTLLELNIHQSPFSPSTLGWVPLTSSPCSVCLSFGCGYTAVYQQCRFQTKEAGTSVWLYNTPST